MNDNILKKENEKLFENYMKEIDEQSLKQDFKYLNERKYNKDYLWNNCFDLVRIRAIKNFSCSYFD